MITLLFHNACIPGDFVCTNLILCPDVIHPVSFSWNLVTRRQKVQIGFSDCIQVQKDNYGHKETKMFYLFPVCF